MTVSIGHLQPIIALLAGILILVMPRLLNYIVAIYTSSPSALSGSGCSARSTTRNVLLPCS